MKRKACGGAARALLVAALTFGGAATAAADRADPPLDYEAIAAQMAARVQHDWRAGAGLWPSLDLQVRSIVLLFEQRALELSIAGTRELDRRMVDALAPDHDGWTYFFADIGPRRATVVSMDAALKGYDNPMVPVINMPESRAGYILDLANHELFHDFQYSTGWRPPSQRDSAVPVPIDADWSLLRALSLEEMRLAIATPALRQQHLANAAYWYNQWRQRFGATDWIRASDIMEGTAQFFSMQLRATGDAVQPADAEERARLLLGYHKPWSTLWPEVHIYSASSSYMLGSLAGTLLDFRGGDWRGQAGGRQTPSELLLNGIAPPLDPPRANPIIVADNAAAVARLDALIEEQLDATIATYLDKQSVLLELPSLWSLPLDPMLAEAVEEARRQTRLEVAREFISALVDRRVFGSWVGGYRVGNGNLFIGNRPFIGGLGDAQVLIPLAPDEFTLEGNRLGLVAADLKGTFDVDIRIGPDGHTLLSVRAQKGR